MPVAALIDLARKSGLKEMEGFELAANKPMLRLAAPVGFSVAIDPDDRSIRLCRRRLQCLPVSIGPNDENPGPFIEVADGGSLVLLARLSKNTQSIE